MGHLIIIFSIISLMTVVSAAYYALQLYNSYKIPILRTQIYYLSSWCLFTAVHLLAMYVSVNISNNASTTAILDLWKAITISEIIIFALIYYAAVRIIKNFEVEKPAYFFKTSIYITGAGIAVALLLFLNLAFNFLSVNNARIGNYFTKVFQILLILAGVVTLIIAAKKEIPGQKKTMIYFAGYLIFTYTIIFCSFLFSTKESLLLLSLIYLSLNIIHIMFIKPMITGFYGRMPVAQNYKAVFDETLRKYGISEREKEIIEMMIHGKSNREIESALYISSHTVKNHVYNIYQKTGVKSRNQLVCLILNNKQI